MTEHIEINNLLYITVNCKGGTESPRYRKLVVVGCSSTENTSVLVVGFPVHQLIGLHLPHSPEGFLPLPFISWSWMGMIIVMKNFRKSQATVIKILVEPNHCPYISSGKNKRKQW